MKQRMFDLMANTNKVEHLPYKINYGAIVAKMDCFRQRNDTNKTLICMKLFRTGGLRTFFMTMWHCREKMVLFSKWC